MTAKGYGQASPIADNATDAGRAVKRRVELRIVDQADHDPDASGGKARRETAGPFLIALELRRQPEPGAHRAAPFYILQNPPNYAGVEFFYGRFYSRCSNGPAAAISH